jgi:hypothetical protein
MINLSMSMNDLPSYNDKSLVLFNDTITIDTINIPANDANIIVILPKYVLG